MNIALFGYGKMGKVIEKIALDRGHHISAKVTSSNLKDSVNLSTTDVVIEFSTPETAIENIKFCLEHKLPVIIGTTGWYSELEQLSKLCSEKGGAMLHATNFSLGVNIFFEINEQLAKIMNKFQDYTPAVIEIHHTEKLDAPSGTGITLCEGIIKHSDQLNSWVNVKKTENSNSEALSIESQRLPNVPGTHEVVYTSTVDDIEIKHTAHNRKGFGLGSVLAAEWILNKKGIFTMRDVLNF